MLQKGGIIKFIYSLKKISKMKKVWNEEFIQGLEELSCEESARIIGGESLWYWIGYGIGTVSRLI